MGLLTSLQENSTMKLSIQKCFDLNSLVKLDLVFHVLPTAENAIHKG